ncbi:hypothetical protein FIE12Z_12228, partial [Fusarium flagelliforme]
PPPPPPLNIPPSRARLQLAARLAMHQKKDQTQSTSDDDEEEENPTDPFADTEEDFDDEPQDRGAWWRDVKRDGNESDDEEEFGDFEMPENADKDKDEGVVRPQPRSLWPFGLSKAETDKADETKAMEVKEAKRRTSIEDPDDDEVVV